MSTKTTEPTGFFWGRVQPWCAATRSELAGPDGWEPVAVHDVAVLERKVLLLGDGRWFTLDEVELGERLVRGG